MEKIILATRLLPSVEMVREDQPSPETMAAVNGFTRRTMTPEDVYVRRAFGIHDAVDSYFSQFPPESVEAVARKSPGAPVTDTHGFEMIGPSPNVRARIFRAARVHRPGIEQPTMVRGSGTGQWGAFDFFWMRGHSQAEDLALEIDGGIQRETSLGWRFALPECSICDKDMRECDHMPGNQYDERVAWYRIKRVERVRHLAFVDRGGQYGTTMDLLRSAGEKTPTQVVDEFLKNAGVPIGEEERDGMIELARCYDGTRKLAKKDRAGWFASLPKAQRGLTWFRKG